MALNRIPPLRRPVQHNERNANMLWTIVLILLVMWLLGLTTAYTAGGLIHVLLVVALVIIVVRLLQGRKPLS